MDKIKLKDGMKVRSLRDSIFGKGFSKIADFAEGKIYTVHFGIVDKNTNFKDFYIIDDKGRLRWLTDGGWSFFEDLSREMKLKRLLKNSHKEKNTNHDYSNLN